MKLPVIPEIMITAETIYIYIYAICFYIDVSGGYQIHGLKDIQTIAKSYNSMKAGHTGYS